MQRDGPWVGGWTRPREKPEERCAIYVDSSSCIREHALFHGDFKQVFNLTMKESRTFFTEGESRVDAALAKRGILLMIEAFEGWAVNYARWLLQAATTTTGRTHRGPAEFALYDCKLAIDPPMSALIERARTAGVVKRTDITRALAQCASHHGLWRHLRDELGASPNERNRFGWR